MIKKFTNEEYDNTKSTGLLTFECEQCGSDFKRQKRFLKSYLKLKELGGKLTLGSIRFCSKSCENLKKISESSVKSKCKNCEIDIITKKHLVNKSKSGNSFCSRSCSASYNNKNKIFGTRRSKLEKWIEENLLEKYNFEILFNDKSVIGSELDIYIPSLKLAFEINGIFHYEPIYGIDKLGSIVRNDKGKFESCIENGISLCIINTSDSKKFKPERDRKYLDIILSIIEKNI
jgi:hypothetical protein